MKLLSPLQSQQFLSHGDPIIFYVYDAVQQQCASVLFLSIFFIFARKLKSLFSYIFLHALFKSTVKGGKE